MKEWKEIKFEELYLEPSKNGLSRSSSNGQQGVKIVNMGELFRYPRMRNPEMRRVTTTERENINFGLKEGDLLFARRSLVAEGAGKCIIVLEVENPTVLESSIIRVRLDKKICSPLFYYYFFSSEIGFCIIQSIVNEVAASGIRSSELAKLKVIYPEVKEQYKIAAILSAYDDLIETNTQRIKLLEETAQQLYKEWFVRMRFPDYKNTKFVKGVPEGWEVKTIAEAFTIVGGGTPSTVNDDYWNGDVNWFSPTDITASKGIFLSESSHKITKKGLKESSATMFPPYSIMMTSRATIGAIGINTSAACTNQGFITCIPNEKIPYTFLYYWIKSNKEIFEMLATGSTFLEITKGTFKKVNILIPKDEVINKYHQIVQSIFQQIENLQAQNTQLRHLRDRLLPRLVSGKLAIKAA
jgi:type I restriction enzyme, S subunit